MEFLCSNKFQGTQWDRQPLYESSITPITLLAGDVIFTVYMSIISDIHWLLCCSGCRSNQSATWCLGLIDVYGAFRGGYSVVDCHTHGLQLWRVQGEELKYKDIRYIGRIQHLKAILNHLMLGGSSMCGLYLIILSWGGSRICGLY